MVLFVSQVWQCASDSLSSHKRSQFELLAELEHDAGVSEDANCGLPTICKVYLRTEVMCLYLSHLQKCKVDIISLIHTEEMGFNGV